MAPTDIHRADAKVPDGSLCGIKHLPHHLLAFRDAEVTCRDCKRIIASEGPEAERSR